MSGRLGLIAAIAVLVVAGWPAGGAAAARLPHVRVVPLASVGPAAPGPAPSPVFRRQLSLGGVVSTVLSPVTATTGALAGAALSAAGHWVLDGARGALEEVAHVIGEATAPQLESAWFSDTYWRVAGIAMLLTVPFLFAAAVQALLRSDLTLLLTAAFGYLPVAVLGVMIASQLVVGLLAATDEMCSIVAGAGVGGGATFLRHTAVFAVADAAGVGAPFLGFVVGVLTVGAALGLTLELLVRAAAVYVVMLMLPLAFAALVWPARRVWAIRLVELLVALVLSKFVIVAVLSLAGSAYGHAGVTGIGLMLTAMALLLLSCFAPWAMMRLLPLAELAAGAAGALRAEVPVSAASGGHALAGLTSGVASAAIPAIMGRRAREAEQGVGGVFGAAVPEPASGSTGDPASEAAPEAAPMPAPAAGADGGGKATAEQRERLPGLPRMYQAPNGAWPPMHLGPDGDWWGGEPPPSEWTPPPEATGDDQPEVAG